MTRRRAGSTLVESLVVILILVALAAWLLPRYLTGGKDASGKKILAPKQRAEQTAGLSYVQQIQQAIQMYKMDNDDRLPGSLSDLKRYGVTDAMLIDPVTKQPLTYDPQTGQVGGSSVPQKVLDALNNATGGDR